MRHTSERLTRLYFSLQTRANPTIPKDNAFTHMQREEGSVACVCSSCGHRRRVQTVLPSHRGINWLFLFPLSLEFCRIACSLPFFCLFFILHDFFTSLVIIQLFIKLLNTRRISNASPKTSTSRRHQTVPCLCKSIIQKTRNLCFHISFTMCIITNLCVINRDSRL